MLIRAIDRYLDVRRAVGFALTVDAGLLRNFARFATDRSETHVRRQTAIEWAAQAPSPYQRERRLGMVRRFVTHARAEDPAYEPLPRHVFAHTRTRPLPYIVSARELRQLLDATARLRPTRSLRPLTYYTLFGLLAATGVRISEALHLVLDDITPMGSSSARRSSARADWSRCMRRPRRPWTATSSSGRPSRMAMPTSSSPRTAARSPM